MVGRREFLVFEAINIPFGCVMLFNVVQLKKDVALADVEQALGEVCNAVKEHYGDSEGGFVGGQVFKYAGFVSQQGSFATGRTVENHIVIVTYWKSFEQHENSHIDRVFNDKFCALLEYCEDIYEIGYQMLWQGDSQAGGKPSPH